MPLQQQIEVLRRRFLSGDELARGTMQRLLQTYLLRVVRRARRPHNARSRAAKGLRRLAQRSSAETRGLRYRLKTDDEICRRLCEDLLQFRMRKPPLDGVGDTIHGFDHSMAIVGAGNAARASQRK